MKINFRNHTSRNIEETKEEHKQNKKKFLSGKLAYIMVNVSNIFIPVCLKQLNDPVTRKQQCV